MRVAVVGLGYVGLPVACLVASSGHDVVGIDINHKIVEKTNTGKTHIEEPGLENLLQKAVKNKSLIATNMPCDSDVYIICVPTPITNSNKPDISAVLASISSISKYLNKDSMVIIESTIPAGTTIQVQSLIKELRPDIDVNKICIAHCPERVLPGGALHEITNNPRVVGGISDESTTKVANFYRSFVHGEIKETNSTVAELVKLSENTFRDVNIAYANELNTICSEFSVLASDVIEIANMHPRVNIHSPGIGVGGHCIPVDPWFLISATNAENSVIKSARVLNQQAELRVLNSLLSLHSSLQTKQIYLLGLTYKPNVDDFRESPALRIAVALSKKLSGEVKCIDPYHKKIPIEITRTINVSKNIPLFSDNSLFVKLVNHEEFKEYSFHGHTNSYCIDAFSGDLSCKHI